MSFLALRMLIGDKAKYFGILVGISFASLLIMQQGAIFLGLTTRTIQFITQTPHADLWVMDPEMEHHSDGKKMLETQLDRVRGVDGVEWAVPMFRAFAQVRLPSGSIRQCILNGIDDATLVGAPTTMTQGSIEALRTDSAILVDAATVGAQLGLRQADGSKIPLAIGDTLELNDHRAVVAGVFSQSPSFFWEPTIYTTFSRAKQFAPRERRQLTFVLLKVKAGFDLATVQQGVRAATGMECFTPGEFSIKTAKYILFQTGILINFAIAIGLGFLVGAAIAGQTFFNFVADNLKYFAALKAIGATDNRIAGMVLVQAMAAGGCGFGLGAGAAALFGQSVGDSLAFFMPWPLLLFGGFAIVGICAGSAFISIRTLRRVSPAMVFKT